MLAQPFPVRVTVSARLVQSDAHGAIDLERCRRFLEGLDAVGKRLRDAWIDAAFEAMAHDEEALREGDRITRDFQYADREAWNMIED